MVIGGLFYRRLAAEQLGPRASCPHSSARWSGREEQARRPALPAASSGRPRRAAARLLHARVCLAEGRAEAARKTLDAARSWLPLWGGLFHPPIFTRQREAVDE